MKVNDGTKNYYKATQESLAPLVTHDEFYTTFLRAIKSGDNTLYQKLIRETRVFDDKWVVALEELMPSIDYIVRNPKSFIKIEKDVVAIERVKKITPDSVRHLSANTQLIREVKGNGDVIPNRLLTQFGEEDLAIYENRFVMTLINKLYTFIDYRYQAIVDHIQSYQRDTFQVDSKFKWMRSDVEFHLSIDVRENINDEELEAKNNHLLERVNVLRNMAGSFKNSPFAKSLARATPVRPPIMKTNILLKNVNYKAAYKIWLYLDMYTGLGFDVDLIEKNLPFETSYIEDIYSLMTMSYSTMFVNQNLGALDYDFSSSKKSKIKRPTILKKLTTDHTLIPGEFKMENNLINEYYFQQTKKLYADEMQGMFEQGTSQKEAFQKILSKIMDMSNGLFQSFIEDQIKRENLAKKYPESDPLRNSKIDLNEAKMRLDLLHVVEKDKKRDYEDHIKEKKKEEKNVERLKLKLEKETKKLAVQKKREELRKKAEIAAKKEKERIRKEKEKLRKEKERALKLERLRKQKEAAALKKAKEKEKKLALAKKAKEQAAIKKAKERAKQQALLKKQKELEAKRFAKEKELARQRAIEIKKQEQEAERIAREKEKAEKLALALKQKEQVKTSSAKHKKSTTSKKNTSKKKVTSKKRKPKVLIPKESTIQNTESMVIVSTPLLNEPVMEEASRTILDVSLPVSASEPVYEGTPTIEELSKWNNQDTEIISESKVKEETVTEETIESINNEVTIIDESINKKDEVPVAVEEVETEPIVAPITMNNNNSDPIKESLPNEELDSHEQSLLEERARLLKQIEKSRKKREKKTKVDSKPTNT